MFTNIAITCENGSFLLSTKLQNKVPVPVPVMGSYKYF